jgi:branched-chain amino acid transport system ATP-binding protein
LARQTALHDRAVQLLEGVGLGAKALHRVSDVSYGEQRRVELAIGLAQKPRLLLLDEPLAGLSQDERGMVQRLIAQVPRDTAILMIEHDMDVALDFAEQITVLHYGQVLVEGDRRTVVEHPRTREIYLGH